MVKMTLNPHGPWYTGQRFIFNSTSGNFEYETVRPEDTGNEETLYFNAKKTIHLMVQDAVDEELVGIAEEYRNQIIDDISGALTTKVNMFVFKTQQNQIVCNLNIDLPNNSACEIRPDNSIHFWKDGVDIGDVKPNIKAGIKILIRKVYDYVEGIGFGNTDRTVKAAGNMLIDLMNQVGIIE